MDKLKDPNIAEAFQAQLGGKFATLYLLDIEDLTSNFSDTVQETAEEVLNEGKQKVNHGSQMRYSIYAIQEDP